jgi:hypothetical protein
MSNTHTPVDNTPQYPYGWDSSDAAPYGPQDPSRPWSQRDQFERPPVQEPKRRGWLLPVVGGGALLLGGAGGFLAAPTPEAETVTKEVEVTREVEVAPQACRDAIDMANSQFAAAAEVNDLSAAMISYAFAAIEAAMLDDYNEVERQLDLMDGASEHLDPLAAQIGRDGAAFDSLASQCRGGAI